MDETEFTAFNCMPKNLIEIICILERGEKCHSYKIIRRRNYFSLVTKFHINAIEEQCFLSTNNFSAGQEKKSCQIESGGAERINLHLLLLDLSLLNNMRIRKLNILPIQKQDRQS